MIPTPEEAWALLCEYNQGEFHQKHSRIVGDVLRWFAQELGYGSEADFWESVGILHDLDFEQWPVIAVCISEKKGTPKLVMKKATVYRSQDGEMTLHIYPNLPQ